MLAQSRLIAFAATKDATVSRIFYEKTLGLRLVSDEPVALVFDANGRMLRIAKVRELAPQPFTVLGWEVEDIAAAVAELGQRGITFERFPGMVQDAKGICSFAGGAKVAWFKDPDGNLLSLTQFAPK